MYNLYYIQFLEGYRAYIGFCKVFGVPVHPRTSCLKCLTQQFLGHDLLFCRITERSNLRAHLPK